MSHFKRTVRCLADYVEDCERYWTKGKTYGACKHHDGNWSIETNLGTIGSVGPDFMLDDFDKYFVEVKKGA